MLRRIFAHVLVAVGLLLSVATSTKELHAPGEATSESVRVNGGTLASGAPILVRVTVDVEGEWFTEDADGTRTEVLPSSQLRAGFRGWEAAEGGSVQLYRGSEGSCTGTPSSDRVDVPGEGGWSSPPSDIVDDISPGTTLVLVYVTGDPVHVGPLELTVALETLGESRVPVQGEVTVHLDAEVLPLDCRVEPEAADTADGAGDTGDTADTATP